MQATLIIENDIIFQIKGKFEVICCYLEMSTWLFLKASKVIGCIVY